jgi:hypothetical protein
MGNDIRGAVMSVIDRHFHERMQALYASLQNDLGIASGDCDPFTTMALERAEQALADIVAPWLFGSLSFDAAESFGIDGTMRS